MKKYLDKVILSIFILLCLFSFFLLVYELPNILNELFDTMMFKNRESFFFFVLVFLLGYVITYHNEIKEKEKHEENVEKNELKYEIIKLKEENKNLKEIIDKNYNN